MGRRFLLATWDGGGSIPPLLGVARRLIARGHAVHVLSDPTVEPEARVAGCSFGPWRTAPHRRTRAREGDLLRDYEHRSPFTFMPQAIREFYGDPGPRWVADVLDELERHPADVVLCDAMLPWPIVAAERLGLRSAALSPNVLLTPTPGLTPAGLGLKPLRGPLGSLRDAVVRSMAGRMFAGAKPTLDAVRAAHGLPPIDSLAAQLWRADRVLILTSAAFDFPPRRAIDRLHWVGPQLDDPSWSEPWASPWPADDRRPLVLVGLGSTFQGQVPTLRALVAALAELPVRALVTLGPAIPLAEVEPRGDVQVVASAPHAQVLREAAVLVGHGGHGVTIKAAAAGVPMLCIPLGRDQADNAVRITARGAGLALARDASVARLRAAITRLLDEPSFRAAASALATKIAAREGDDDVVEILEGLLA